MQVHMSMWCTNVAWIWLLLAQSMLCPLIYMSSHSRFCEMHYCFCKYLLVLDFWLSYMVCSLGNFVFPEAVWSQILGQLPSLTWHHTTLPYYRTRGYKLPNHAHPYMFLIHTSKSWTLPWIHSIHRPVPWDASTGSQKIHGSESGHWENVAGKVIFFSDFPNSQLCFLCRSLRRKCAPLCAPWGSSCSCWVCLHWASTFSSKQISWNPGHYLLCLKEIGKDNL